MALKWREMTSPCADAKTLDIFMVFVGKKQPEAKKRAATRNKSSDILGATRRFTPNFKPNSSKREGEKEKRVVQSGKNFSYLRASLFPRAAAYGYQVWLGCLRRGCENGSERSACNFNGRASRPFRVTGRFVPLGGQLI